VVWGFGGVCVVWQVGPLLTEATDWNSVALDRQRSNEVHLSQNFMFESLYLNSGSSALGMTIACRRFSCFVALLEYVVGVSPVALPMVELTFVSDRGSLPFELFLPRQSTSPGTLSPVLVFLHGRGESGAFDVTNAQSLPLQLLTNKSFAASFPFITIVPQCPWECAQFNGWLDTTLGQLTDVIKWVVNEHVGDPARVYLAGQSMGGNGAVSLPTRFFP